MNDFVEKLKTDLQQLSTKAQEALAKLTGKQPTTAKGPGGSLITTAVNTNYEINLVPEVKMQMIKAQKVRNLVLFLCIVVSSVAVGAVVILFGIKSGQDIALAGKDSKLEAMSAKLNEYGELNNLLTIQNQLTSIEEIVDQKTVAARVFAALGVMMPQGADIVQLSELNLNLSTNLLRMDGQADAKAEPLIDYRVLESFKKGVEMTKYDYGEYVDVEGNTIPTYCISEADAQGNAYKVGDNYYAWWDLTIDGCQGSQRGGTEMEGAELYYSMNAEVEAGYKGEEPIYETVCDESGANCKLELMEGKEDDGGKTENEDNENSGNDENTENAGDETENGENGDAENGGTESGDTENGGETEEENKVIPLRVKIWRTPQFNAWYKAGKMLTDGTITNVEHFVSSCISYRGTTTGTGSDIRWTSTNDCMLAPEGLTVTESSNARDESNNLVLKFSGTVTLAEDYFMYKNKHMIAIGPMGQNVTDSYIQIGNMFAQEAKDCAPDDTECMSSTNNRGER